MNDDTKLLRQVHPQFIINGRVSSQAFRPTPKDKQLLSVYDGDLIAADAAYEHYSTSLELESNGVLAVTVEECVQIELSARPDPMTNFSEHAVIDFSSFGKKEMEKKAKLLKVKAEQRDWLFQIANV